MTLGAFQNDIKIRTTRSYSPQANGMAEQKNKLIRRKLKSVFALKKNLIWINELERIENTINNSFNSGKKIIPNQIWKATNKKFDVLQPDELTNFEKAFEKKINQITKNKIEKFKDEYELKNGDFVRVKLSALYSNMRKLVKSGKSKEIQVIWTPSLYKIVHTIYPRRRGLERNRYQVVNKNAEKLPFQLYANELQLIPELKEFDDKFSGNITNAEALKLNGVEPLLKEFEW
jgi:IS30 family transposase